MAFTYLCAPFSVSAQSADSLAVEALRLEREIFVAPSAAKANYALLAKAEVRKQQGLYADASNELTRVSTWALTAEQSETYYHLKALCQYLAADFGGATATIDEARIYLPQDAPTLRELLLIDALASGEKGEWARSEKATRGEGKGKENLRLGPKTTRPYDGVVPEPCAWLGTILCWRSLEWCGVDGCQW